LDVTHSYQKMTSFVTRTHIQQTETGPHRRRVCKNIHPLIYLLKTTKHMTI